MIRIKVRNFLQRLVYTAHTPSSRKTCSSDCIHSAYPYSRKMALTRLIQSTFKFLVSLIRLSLEHQMSVTQYKAVQMGAVVRVCSCKFQKHAFLHLLPLQWGWIRYQYDARPSRACVLGSGCTLSPRESRMSFSTVHT